MRALAIALPVVVAPTSPTDRFFCQHYRCNLEASDCVGRQTTKRERNHANGQGHRFVRVYVPPHLQFCASGKCEQGKAIAAAVPPKTEGAAA